MGKQKILKEQSIKINFIYNMAYQVFSVLTPLITSPIISRRLGAEALGEYSYSYSVAYYFLVFGMLGLKNYGSRYIAQHRNSREELSKAFWSLYSFQLLSTSIFILLYLLYTVFLCNKNGTLAYIQILLVLSSMFDISWFYFGIEQFKATATRNFLIKLLNVICIVLLIKEPSDLWIYTLIMAGGVLISQIVLWPFVRDIISFCKPEFKEIMSHFHPNVILFVPVIATNLFKYMDKIMLGNWVAMSELGYYENAEKLVQIPNSIVTAIGTVMLPRMSNIVSVGDKKQYNRLISNSMLLSICLSCAMAFGILGVSEYFVPWFFGEEFIPVTQLLYWLLPCMPFICWADVIRTQYLIPNKKDMGYLVSYCCGAALNIIINAVLIPKMGAVGAAVGTLVAEASVSIIQTIMVVKVLPIGKFLLYCVPFVGIGMLMCFGICLFNADNIVLTIIIRVLLGGAIYGLLTLIYLWSANRQLLKQFMKLKH